VAPFLRRGGSVLGRKIAVSVFCLLAVMVTTLAWSGMSLRDILNSLFGF